MWVSRKYLERVERHNDELIDENTKLKCELVSMRRDLRDADKRLAEMADEAQGMESRLRASIDKLMAENDRLAEENARLRAESDELRGMQKGIQQWYNLLCYDGSPQPVEGEA